VNIIKNAAKLSSQKSVVINFYLKTRFYFCINILIIKLFII